jgi:hypothetical protein
MFGKIVLYFDGRILYKQLAKYNYIFKILLFTFHLGGLRVDPMWGPNGCLGSRGPLGIGVVASAWKYNISMKTRVAKATFYIFIRYLSQISVIIFFKFYSMPFFGPILAF